MDSMHHFKIFCKQLKLYQVEIVVFFFRILHLAEKVENKLILYSNRCTEENLVTNNISFKNIKFPQGNYFGQDVIYGHYQKGYL